MNCIDISADHPALSVMLLRGIAKVMSVAD
jgi:hypothetical protein